ncbi:Transcriptional regulator, TetR family [Methylocella tundrae]|uniref:Transcriptional regulator, TetR family n=1 Tax=Methylocella tundrae TaxID=227605 RepID=A0A8B6M8U1_METTU|nr:TetR/AcrR family transcriptional regulator [Methylocella tundrae]VTZ26909.1 Transcriptional regulator, TetR family [Methylocella tundrae]VTZ51447.1 Transcriptional regulator, TetR family [Methylocella tundrae]
MKDTRLELLTKAEALVRSRGYSGFSYADLALAVGVRTASIHYYFPAKKDLGVALVAFYDERYDAEMAGILRSTDDGLERVTAYARLYLSGLEQKLGCLCAVLAITPEFLPTEIRDAVRRFFRKHFLWLKTVLEEGRANGSIRKDIDCDQQARVAIALLEGALLMEPMLDGSSGFMSAIAALQSQLRPASKGDQSPKEA